MGDWDDVWARMCLTFTEIVTLGTLYKMHLDIGTVDIGLYLVCS